MPMYDPPHPGETIRDVPDHEGVGRTVTECARRPGGGAQYAVAAAA